MIRTFLVIAATFILATAAQAETDGDLAQNHLADLTALTLQETSSSQMMPIQAMRHAATDRAGSPLALSIVRNKDNAFAANAVANLPTLGAAERQSRATAVSGNTMSAPDGATTDANRTVTVE